MHLPRLPLRILPQRFYVPIDSSSPAYPNYPYPVSAPGVLASTSPVAALFSRDVNKVHHLFCYDSHLHEHRCRLLSPTNLLRQIGIPILSLLHHHPCASPSPLLLLELPAPLPTWKTTMNFLIHLSKHDTRKNTLTKRQNLIAGCKLSTYLNLIQMNLWKSQNVRIYSKKTTISMHMVRHSKRDVQWTHLAPYHLVERLKKVAWMK